MIGTVQGGNPVLFSINDCWFPFGTTLSGNVLLFNGKRPETTLTALVGALATATVGVSAVMCTRPPPIQQQQSSNCWLALRTVDVLDEPSLLNRPEATFVAQLAF